VNGKFDPASVPADAKAWIVLKNHYALSPDFSTLVVRSDMDFYRQQPGDSGDRWRSHPCYETTLIYQSDALAIPPKTDADRARLVAEENSHWDQAAINRDIRKVNDAGFTTDPGIRTLRRTVADRIHQHKQALQDAQAPYWTLPQRADWFASAWAGDNAARLQAAIAEAGRNLDAMLGAAFAPSDDPALSAAPAGPVIVSAATPAVASTANPASASTAAVAATSDAASPEARPVRTISVGKHGEVYSLPVEQALDVGQFITGQ
jgi:hypothetical protein